MARFPRSHASEVGHHFALLQQRQHTSERHCSLPAAMQITVGSYVRIHEHRRNRVVRGLLCRVQALEFRRLSFVPTQFAQVRVLGLEEHIQGDAPEWWMPCSAMRYVGDAASCIGTHDAQAAARCFLPFLFGSTGTIESSLEVSLVQWTMMSVAARLRQARACAQDVRGCVLLPRGTLAGLRRERVGRAHGHGHGHGHASYARDYSLPADMCGLSAHPVTGAVILHRL